MSMKMTMAEFVGLEPCPFCGGEDSEINHAPTYNTIHPDVYRVHCCVCGADGSEEWTEAEAIAAWNSRAERTCRSTTDDNAWCFVCSECGKSFPRSQLHLAHNHGEINYCPNCGKAVKR